MKRKFFLFLTLFAFLHAFAANEFKINDMKVLILADQTAEIKEYKKAAGNYTIPTSVTDPKTKKSYPLISIGKEAFKGSKLTSITIPTTITHIGEGAFKNSKELKIVNWDTEIDEIPVSAFEGCKGLREIKFNSSTPLSIGRKAFMKTGLRSISIPSNVNRIEREAFGHCSDLTDLTIEPGTTPIRLEWIFYGTPLKNIKLLRPYENTKDPSLYGYYNVNQPFDHNPTLTSMVIGLNVSHLSPDILEGSTGLKKLIIEGDIERFFPNEESKYFSYIIKSLPQNSSVIIDGKELKPQEAINLCEVVVENKKFKTKWENLVETARKDPHLVPDLYSMFSPKDFVRNKEIIMRDINDLCDNVFLPKQNLTSGDVSCLEIFQNNFIQSILVDYGFSANSNVEAWARQDILRKDIASNSHKKEYEKLEAIPNKSMNHKNANKDYSSLIKLIGLCGQGKWKEASNYFPTAKSLLTQNGRYLEPYPLKYIQGVLEEKGYKVGTKSSPNKKNNSKKGGKRK